MWTRRFLLKGCAALGVVATVGCAQPVRTAPPVITLLGDSVFAGYGLSSKDALPVRLQAALTTRGIKAVVRGAGVSGDTTADGLARLDRSVARDTTVCVIELGANDFLRMVNPERITDNLTAIAKRLTSRGTTVIMLGGLAPVGTPPAYANRFNEAFSKAAARSQVTLVPDFFHGILESPSLVQPDRFHPNARGAQVLADRLVAPIAEALRVKQVAD